jgi:hypothetical protein
MIEVVSDMDSHTSLLHHIDTLIAWHEEQVSRLSDPEHIDLLVVADSAASDTFRKWHQERASLLRERRQILTKEEYAEALRVYVEITSKELKANFAIIRRKSTIRKGSVDPATE